MIRKSVFFYMIVIFFAACIFGGSVFSTYEFFLSDGPLSQRKEVVIEKGQPLRKIANYLHQEGVIESPAIFVLGVRVSQKDGELKAGEYSIPAHASAKMVMDIITGGQTFIRRITVPEGLTSYQVVQMLNDTKSLEGEIIEIPQEGSLLPETYYYSAGDTRISLIKRMQSAMTRTIEELWPKREKDLLLKNTKDVIILASIIEKETSIDAERNHIASVFFNRLKQKMRLQSDPTVIYGLSEGTGIFKRKLFSNDLKKQDPYNTYVIYGLPPGPISNPGRASIEAVLHPDKTQDLYFVANGKGGHAFSENYKDHQNRVSEWRNIKKKSETSKQKTKQKKMKAVSEAKTVPQDEENKNK